MQTPVEIDFQGLKGNEKLRASVLKHIAVLEQRFGRITACRVVIKAPSERHRTGGACEITIRLSLPQGREVPAMMVPPAEGQRDASSPRFDEPPREHELLHQLGGAVVAVIGIALAVALAELWILAVDVEGVDQLA